MSNSKNPTTTKPRPKNKKKAKQPGQKPTEIKLEVVSVPAARSKIVPSSSPKITQNSAKLTRIKHREYIDNINGSSPFFAWRYDINPGMPASFPWLSGVARNWEKYRFHSLKYIYVPRCSTASNGNVMLAVDYDAADASPISDSVLLAYDCSKDGPVWSELNLTCPKEKLQEKGLYRYVRHAAVLANLDIKTYDVGKAIIATSESSSAALCGRLFVEYDVELYIPQVPAEGFEAVSSVNANSGGTLTAAYPLGTNPVASTNSAGILSNDGTHNFVGGLSPGSYNLTHSVTGTTLGALQAPVIASGPGSILTLNAAMINAAANTVLGQWLVQNAGLQTLIQLPYLASAAAVTQANLRMNKVMADVTFP